MDILYHSYNTFYIEIICNLREKEWPRAIKKKTKKLFKNRMLNLNTIGRTFVIRTVGGRWLWCYQGDNHLQPKFCVNTQDTNCWIHCISFTLVLLTLRNQISLFCYNHCSNSYYKSEVENVLSHQLFLK